MAPKSQLGIRVCDALNRLFKPKSLHGRDGYEQYADYEYAMAVHTLEELQPISLVDKVVLDIGCGSGGKSVFYAQQEVKQLIAIDIEPNRLAASRQYAEKHGLGPDTIAFVQADAARLPFEEGQFDVILANDSFEHIFDLEDTVRECFRVLKPGGMLGFNLLPYPSKDGAHLYDYIRVPWCQWVLPEPWLVDYW